MKNKEILFIILLSLILCYPVISIHIFENKQSDIYKNAVEEYNAININPYFNTKEAYEMGLNSLGKPIFKNVKGAFKQAMSDFKKSCEFLETELQFGTVQYNWQEYVQQRAWQPQCEEELQYEMNLLFTFLNVYKNSFDQFY